jgi:Co/Zn/Cd efflux system component
MRLGQARGLSKASISGRQSCKGLSCPASTKFLIARLGSVGAIASGALIWAFGWNWADPVGVALEIVTRRDTLDRARPSRSGCSSSSRPGALIKEAVSVLMESVPGNVDLDAIRAALRGVDGVEEVHGLHVWSISSGMVSLSCHVVARGPLARDGASSGLLVPCSRASSASIT